MIVFHSRVFSCKNTPCVVHVSMDVRSKLQVCTPGKFWTMPLIHPQWYAQNSSSKKIVLKPAVCALDCHAWLRSIVWPYHVSILYLCDLWPHLVWGLKSGQGLSPLTPRCDACMFSTQLWDRMIPFTFSKTLTPVAGSLKNIVII